MGPDGQVRDGGGGARRLGAVVAAAAVVAIAAGVFVWLGDDSDGPPRLSLAEVAAGSLGESAREPALGAPVGGAYGWGEWRLEGDLPQGPSSAPVYRLLASIGVELEQ